MPTPPPPKKKKKVVPSLTRDAGEQWRSSCCLKGSRINTRKGKGQIKLCADCPQLISC